MYGPQPLPNRDPFLLTVCDGLEYLQHLADLTREDKESGVDPADCEEVENV